MSEQDTKTDIKAAIISVTIPFTVIMLILSVWSRVSVEFGIYFMQAFHSVHPHPFTVTAPGLLWYEHIFGVLFDVFYTAVDTAFLTGIIVFLYNRLKKP